MISVTVNYKTHRVRIEEDGYSTYYNAYIQGSDTYAYSISTADLRRILKANIGHYNGHSSFTWKDRTGYVHHGLPSSVVDGIAQCGTGYEDGVIQYAGPRDIKCHIIRKTEKIF